MAVIAATTMGAASATMNITGSYEGVASTNSGPAAYTQDLDLTLKAKVGDTTVKATIENLTGGSTLKTKQLYIATKLEGLDFKGGTYKTLNGTGLLQKKVNANQLQIATSIAGASLAVNQVSGDGNATVDASTSIAGVDVNVQNVSATDRFITVVADFFGFNTSVETQKTATGRNTAVAAGLTVPMGGSNIIDVTGVYMDVKDTAGVTQNDGILGDVSDATTGSTVKGGVASLNTSMGAVTGKYIVKNDKNTYVGELQRGVWTFGHSKTEDQDGVTTAKINVAF